MGDHEHDDLYDQTNFKSRDVVLTFHVGLMARIMHGSPMRLTPFDIGQTGITPDMLAGRPYAGEVLAEPDRASAPRPTCSSPTTSRPKPG